MRCSTLTTVALTAFAAALVGCQSKEGGSGSAGGFPEKGLAVYKGKLKQGENAFDHALAEKYPAARAAVGKITGKMKPQKGLTDDEKGKIDAAVKQAGFEAIDQFYKMFNDLLGARIALKHLSNAEKGEVSGFQKAVAEKMVEDYTEADLRLAHKLK